MSYIEDSLAKLKHFEGTVLWMYLDSVGKVTILTGLMLPSAIPAVGLPFRVGARLATENEVIADFNRVKVMAPGKLPAFYKSPTSPTLTDADADANLQEKVNNFETYLRNDLKGYDTYPDAAKIALIDMAYNLGPVGLLTKYPHLIAAVKVHNWPLCAAQCHRNGPNQERNDWTARMFAEAA